jgi:hypothetical protein
MRSRKKGALPRYRGEPVISPHIVTLTIKAKGKRDIAPAAFGDFPLPFDVTARIIECIEVTTDPDDQPVPCVTIKGSKLELHPIKIGKRETIRVRLFVDGEPKLRKPVQSLIDVPVVNRKGRGELGWTLVQAIIVIIVVAAIAAFAAITHIKVPPGTEMFPPT